MPYTPALMVKNLLKQRHKVTDRDQIKQISVFLFDLALRDQSAAEALLAQPNRFVEQIPDIIAKEQLVQFARTYDNVLVEKLIKLSGLSNTQLAQDMRQEVVKKPLLDKKIDDLLNRVRRIHNQRPAPQVRTIDDISRTRLAVEHNPLLRDRNNKKGIMHGNVFIPMVNRETRDFNQKLCSVGSSSSREVILLDPEEQLLKKLYQHLKSQLPSTNDPQRILEEVKKLTRQCFKGTEPESLIRDNLRADNPIISLSEFIKKSEGVCRHHTLLNAYFLSRLNEDGILKGDVIHHRQNFAGDGAHTWNIFRAQNGKVYSLDSLWNDVTCITDNPGAINSLYREDVEAKIQAMHFTSSHQNEPVNLPPEPVIIRNGIDKQPLSSAEKIHHIKQYIENNRFSVGDYLFWQGGLMLKLDDGTEKRVPHRVYEIYQAIRNCDVNHPVSTQKAWETIQTHAQNALNKPRPGQDGKTKEFYNRIVNDNLVVLETEINFENKPRI